MLCSLLIQRLEGISALCVCWHILCPEHWVQVVRSPIKKRVSNCTSRMALKARKTTLGLTKCRFGEKIMEALTDHHHHELSDKAWNRFLIQWRAEIRHELTNNLSGALCSWSTKLVSNFPETFLAQMSSDCIFHLLFPNLFRMHRPGKNRWFSASQNFADKFCWSAGKAREKFTSTLPEGVFLLAGPSANPDYRVPPPCRAFKRSVAL